jgi:hypothetical protein
MNKNLYNNSIKWNEQFKIRLANPDKSMDLHDIIKIMVVRKLIQKYKSNKSWIRIYTEFELNEGSLIPDIYIENLKEKSIICYEIQNNLAGDYVTKKTKSYSELVIPYFNSVDLIVIPIKNAPDEISKLSLWLEQYVF